MRAGSEGVIAINGLLPGRGGILLLGVREHQHPVDVHDHLAVGGRTSRRGQFPDLLAHLGTCALH